MPSSVDVSPLLMPAARKYAASDAMRMSAADGEAEAATDRGAVHRRDHRLVHVADGEDHVVEHLHRPPGDARALQPGDVRHHAAADEVGTRAEPVTGAGEHDDPALVVEADLAQRVAERDHHVERHRVHALGAVERDQRDVRSRLLDLDERHGRSLRRAPVGAARTGGRARRAPHRRDDGPVGGHPDLVARLEAQALVPLAGWPGSTTPGRRAGARRRPSRGGARAAPRRSRDRRAPGRVPTTPRYQCGSSGCTASMRPSPSSTGATRRAQPAPKELARARSTRRRRLGGRPGGVQIGGRRARTPRICTEPLRRPAVRKKSHNAGECARRSVGIGERPNSTVGPRRTRARWRRGSRRDRRPSRTARRASPSPIVRRFDARRVAGHIDDGK